MERVQADLKNKKVLIMGLGLHGGGVGSAEFFARLGSRVIVTDLKTKRELIPSIAKLSRFKNITYHLGGHRGADFRTADYIIKGPGVAENSKFLKIAKRSGVPILSDVEIFFLACPAPIIGITGTKGKSTATYLLGQFLKKGLWKRFGSAQRRRIWVGGNIRRSVLEFLARVRKNDLVVLELSSFQLDSLKHSRRSPGIALLTNVFPDHLNRYPSLAAYSASKVNIFRFQRRDGILFINARDRLLGRLARRAPGRVVRFNPAETLRPFRKAVPAHVPAYQWPGVAGAVVIAQHLGVGERAIRQTLRAFRGLPGRMEFVQKIRGVEFINDTTATNPHAAEEAVISTKRRIGRQRLVVIAGGYDKGLVVSNFVRALVRHAATVVFLPGTATRKMKQRLQKLKKPQMFPAKTMPEAVRAAYRNAKAGDAVLLSPGAASFGLFQHEFDRGEQFAAAVRKLR